MINGTLAPSSQSTLLLLLLLLLLQKVSFNAWHYQDCWSPGPAWGAAAWGAAGIVRYQGHNVVELAEQ
jgi:hypothetical protein